MNKIYIFLIVIILMLTGIYFAILESSDSTIVPVISNDLGSVQRGGEYYSTTTRAVFNDTNQQIVTGKGTLGSVIITGSAGMGFNLYDATTTKEELRTITATTSLSLLATFEEAQTVGVYVYDTNFTDGLMVDWNTTTGIATTTITYKER